MKRVPRPAASADRKLMDRLAAGTERWGRIEALFATSYELDPDFVEVDLMPSLFGLGAWDDRGWTSRIALERALAQMESAAIVMQADRYRGRPRPLRLEVSPFAVRGECLHAKVLLVVHENAVRLLVGSANLTTPGYRENREVAVIVEADARSAAETSLVRQALDGMPARLRGRLAEGARRSLDLARGRLDEWGVGSLEESTWFVWGGGERALVDEIVGRWEGPEPLDRIAIVSPFWSDADAHETVRELVRRVRPLSRLDGGGSLEIRLLTEAARLPDGTWRPQAPASFLGLNAGHPGTRVTMQAVSPAVTPEEVGGREDFRGVRPLHAKVAVLEGPETSLAYLGSANFTRRGWGFVDDPARANIEAGILLRRRGRERAALSALLPEAIGPVIDLSSATASDVAAPHASPAAAACAYFVREVVLEPSPDRPDVLDLVVAADPEAAEFEVETREDEPKLLIRCGGGRDRYRMTPSEETLKTLLQTREVVVSSATLTEPVTVPLNVSLAARTALPIAPDERRPDELLLVSYYQGRLSWEELFEDPEAPLDRARLASASSFVGSAVDTSRIQSYQVRAFVQALQGIRDDLRAAVISEPSIRLAIRGPVSPVALAKQVAHAAKRHERSATAAAFQLAEVLAQIDAAWGFPVPERLSTIWKVEIDAAGAEVRRLLEEIRNSDLERLGPGTSFGRYASALASRAQRSGLP